MAAWRFVLWTALFLAFVGACVVSVGPQILSVFMANPELNGFIGAVFLGGLLYGLLALVRLTRGLSFLETSDHDSPYWSATSLRGSRELPALLEPLDTLLREGKESSSSARIFLQEFYGALFQNTHEGLRYGMGSLVFLGLLGTFWGLSLTIQSISHVLAQLPTQETAGTDFFALLKESLQRPLAGMGTAFGSSLFGISASIVLGFVDVQLNKLGNTFLLSLERLTENLQREPLALKLEPLSEKYVGALIPHLVEQLEKLQRVLTRGEADRAALNETLDQLGQKIGRLADQMRAEQPLLLKMAEGQSSIQGALKALVHEIQGQPLQESLKWQTSQMEQILSQFSNLFLNAHRDTLEALREELRLLTRVLSQQEVESFDQREQRDSRRFS